MLRSAIKAALYESFKFYDVYALNRMISNSTGSTRAFAIQLHDWEIERVYADRQQLHYAVAITN